MLNRLLSGFRLTSWSVVPYLCEGDQTTAYYTLRDTILIFDKLWNTYTFTVYIIFRKYTVYKFNSDSYYFTDTHTKYNNIWRGWIQRKKLYFSNLILMGFSVLNKDHDSWSWFSLFLFLYVLICQLLAPCLPFLK